MATWNHGDKTAGSTVQFNGKSYITRKDTGQTVYDNVASTAADPGLAAEIASIKTQLQSVSTGSGSGFGTVQFAGDNSTTYYYRKIKASISKTVREEFETDILAMSDGSLPSAAILLINCVNLNDSTFASPDRSRAQVMYRSPASSTATPTCYINSRGSSSSGGTYGPGTQAIVPIHANGRAKLIAHINKLAPGQIPDDCFLEMWVVGVMGGGGSVPDNNYVDLLKRVETLENNSSTVTGTIDLGAVGYTFTAQAKRAPSLASSTWDGHALSNFEPITDAIPSYADSDKNFSENTGDDHAITGEITNSSGTYRLLYSPPIGGTRRDFNYIGHTTVGTAFRVK